MVVFRALPVVAALSLSSLALCQGPMRSDWAKVKFDPVARAKTTEKVYKSFKMVACGVRLFYNRYPVAGEPKGYGSGQAILNEYFWQPGKFRIEYVALSDHPVPEYLASDGKITRRLGAAVGAKNTIYRASQGFFNVGSDAQLVELWPKRFSQYLFSPFAGGNATLSRYVAALKKGVGGYQLSTWERVVAFNGKFLRQYRILATRKAKGKLPESRVEMIFDAKVYLPLTVLATYGKNFDFEWRTVQWSNHAKIPGTPFEINQ